MNETLETQGTIIIDDNLLNIIRRAEYTRQFYMDNKRKTDLLKKSEHQALQSQKNIRDIALLDMIIKEMNNIKNTSTRSGLFSDKTSKSTMITAREKIKKENQSLINMMKNNLAPMPLMKKEYYLSCINSYDQYSTILKTRYKRSPKLLSSIKPEKYKETAERIIRSESTKIGSECRVKNGIIIDENGEKKQNYKKESSIIDAGLEVYKTEEKIRLDRIIEDLRKSDTAGDTRDIYKSYEDHRKSIESEYDNIINNLKLDYKNKSMTNIQKTNNELKQVLKDYYDYKMSYTMLKRIKNIITQEIKHDFKIGIEQKIDKELSAVESKLVELEKQKKELEATFEQERNKITTETKEQKTSHIEKIKELEELKEKVQKLQKIEENKKKDNPEEKKQEKKTNEVNRQEKEKYEKYKVIREKLDDIIDRRNSFSNENYYHQEIVNTFYSYGLGTTYDEIIKNIIAMREDLIVNKRLQTIIDTVKMDFDDFKDMRKEEKNGMTKIENKIEGRLLSLEMNPDTPEEVKEEIRYYLKRNKKCQDDLYWITQNKNSYPEDTYKQIVDNIKVNNYLNTNIFDEVNPQPGTIKAL